MHEEPELLVRAGLTPRDALRAATLTPAKFLGREDDLGTVARGSWPIWDCSTRIRSTTFLARRRSPP
jgi:N-acetylglucosamine-6-phosphate deacetylase